MAWANASNIITTNVDNAADDPSQARADIYAALVELAAVINGRNTSNGVCGLDSSGLVPAARLPDAITSSSTNNLLLQPNTARVGIEDIINLAALTVTELNALTAVTGDIAYCSNGDSGSKCLAFYNGTAWKRIALGTTISAT